MLLLPELNKYEIKEEPRTFLYDFKKNGFTGFVSVLQNTNVIGYIFIKDGSFKTSSFKLGNNILQGSSALQYIIDSPQNFTFEVNATSSDVIDNLYYLPLENDFNKIENDVKGLFKNFNDNKVNGIFYVTSNSGISIVIYNTGVIKGFLNSNENSITKNSKESQRIITSNDSFGCFVNKAEYELPFDCLLEHVILKKDSNIKKVKEEYVTMNTTIKELEAMDEDTDIKSLPEENIISNIDFGYNSVNEESQLSAKPKKKKKKVSAETEEVQKKLFEASRLARGDVGEVCLEKELLHRGGLDIVLASSEFDAMLFGFERRTEAIVSQKPLKKALEAMRKVFQSK